jgi:predicted acetylornithine/succinylornithine family transaminase
MSTSEKLTRYVLPTYGRFPITPVRGEGPWIWDEKDVRYLDFCGGIAVCSLGHCPPSLTDALSRQAETLLHCSNLYQIPQQADLAELIVERCVGLPGKVFFSNSGAEANDGLIKLARRFGGTQRNKDGEARYEVITFGQSFHGRTLGAMSATGQPKIQEGFDPLLPGFKHVPFNDALALQNAITPLTAAVLLEPIQGEGGVNVAEPDFLRAVKRLCDEHDLLLLLDEVQCGFGRTGQMMGWRSILPDLEPDGISWAKGMGGGFPVGAFWVNDRFIGDQQTPLFTVLGPGSHGSTYGGNPLASAASLAVLGEILDQELPANALAREEQIRTEISSWNHPGITGVRGCGLLLGVGLNPTVLTPPKEKTAALHLCSLLMDKGLLVPPAGPETIRLLPPLNISEEDTATALSILKSTLESYQ